VKLNMPRPDQPPPPTQPTIHTLVVDFDGSITWDSTPVPTMAALDNYFTEVANQPHQDEIHLQPNRLAKYDTIAKILSDAQNIGVKNIGFSGEEQYMH